MTTITTHQWADLQALAQNARPRDNGDWGSKRQSKAEEAFWNQCAKVLGQPYGAQYDGSGLGEQFDSWCERADTDEMLTEALRLLAERIR